MWKREYWKGSVIEMILHLKLTYLGFLADEPGAVLLEGGVVLQQGGHAVGVVLQGATLDSQHHPREVDSYLYNRVDPLWG